MPAEFKITGDKALLKKLNRLKGSTRKKVMRQAVAAAVRPIRSAAKSEAPVEFGVLKKRLTVKVKAYKSGNVFGMVSVSNEAKDEATGRRPSKYLHLVTLGTKPHEIKVKQARELVAVNKKTGDVRKFGPRVNHPGAKPNDFLQRAIGSQRQASLDKFSEVLRAAILREAKRS